MIKEVSLIVMGIFYIFAGIMHFIKPKFYLRIMPPFLPYHLALVYISGIAEIALGILLFFPFFTVWAAWGIIALLVAVFPANIYQMIAKGAGMKVSRWVLILRLPIQFLFIAWAWWHTF